MLQDEILRLVAQGEGQRVEFKTGLAEQHKALETLCAFLNSEGGHVLIGVRPNGEIAGVTVGRNTLENIAAAIARIVDPRPYPSIDAIQVGATTVIVLSVDGRKPGQIFFASGKAWVRVGAINTWLSAKEITTRVLETYDQRIARALREHDDRFLWAIRSHGIAMP